MALKKAMLINLQDKKAVIRPQLYGHFLEQASRIVNDGIFVGKDSSIPNRDGVRLDVIQAWKDMGVTMLHWPGGITSEGYEWRKGVGENRIPNINSPFFGTEDPNAFGTDEFMNLCEYLGCESYIVAGTISNSVLDLRDWVQYITAERDSCEMSRLREKNGHPEAWKLTDLCIGNEWWYTDKPETYAEYFARYRFAANPLMGNQGKSKDRPKIIARGPHLYDSRTTAELVSKLRPGTYDAIGFYIVGKPKPNCSSSAFTTDDYLRTLAKIQLTDEMIDTNLGIMHADPRNKNVRLSIDEWGTWYENEPEWTWKQTVTMRDVIAASQQLDIFHRHAKDIEAASVAMSINCLCSSMITEGEKFYRTPVFDVFKLYKEHQGAQLLGSWLEPQSAEVDGAEVALLSHSASVKDGKMHLTVTNGSVDDSCEISILLYGGNCKDFTAQIVTGALTDANSFDAPDRIRAREFTDFTVEGDKIKLVLPPMSLVALDAKLV